MRRFFALGGVLLLLTGCGPTYYRNFVNPSANWDRDQYECRRENTYPIQRHPPGPYGGLLGWVDTEVDESGVYDCLRARGWRRVSAPAPGGALPVGGVLEQRAQPLREDRGGVSLGAARLSRVDNIVDLSFSITVGP